MKIKVIIIYNLLLTAIAASAVTVTNNVVSREVTIDGGNIKTAHWVLQTTGAEFVNDNSREFSFIANGKVYTGQSQWRNIVTRETNGGAVVTMDSNDGSLRVTLTYQTYKDLPVVHKWMSIENLGKEDVCIEAVDVEDINVALDPIESWTLRQYARYKALGAYVGNWDDPLVIVHDNELHRGIAVGNEAIGVLKRTSVFVDGRSVTAGVTRPEQDYPFRRWLRQGDVWESPRVFTAIYDREVDPMVVLNTTVQDFVRRHVNVRIEQISHKPMFVYNTWYPFMRDIDDKMIRQLAKAAADCGIEEFVIDDGWQLNIDSPEGQPEFMGDWMIDRKKFPKGMKPVFDYIKQLGMKPGLWISLATADISSRPYKEHAEWFVRDKNGQLADLHNQDATRSRTACFGTLWYDYIKETILRLRREYGLAYVKLDLAVLASAYVYDVERTGCYATDHPDHRDRAESFGIIYARCMQLFDELHHEAPDLFVDCTFETAGKLQLMDYGIARHAEGNWLSNVPQYAPTGTLRIRQLGWGRSPALPATSLVIGNLRMEDPEYELALKSLAGTLPIMLGDPRQLTTDQRARYKQWATWLKQLEARHSFMAYRQDLPGFGEPQEGCWDGFLRLNTDTRSGGLIGVFRQGSTERSRTITIPSLKPDATYEVLRGNQGALVATLTGRQLAEEGFTVTLPKEYDGELFEVTRK